MGKAAEDPPRHGVSKKRSSSFASLQLLKSLSPKTLLIVMRLCVPFTSLTVAQSAAKEILPACISTTR
jgi:hypothetical protein